MINFSHLGGKNNLKDKQLKDKLKKVILCFVMLILIFTVVSKNAKSYITPYVKVDVPKSKTISQEVTGTGEVTADSEKIVPVTSEVIIENILVNKNQNVNVDTPLFSINIDSLNQKISIITNDIEKLNKQKEESDANYYLDYEEYQLKKNQAQQKYAADNNEENKKELELALIEPKISTESEQLNIDIESKRLDLNKLYNLRDSGGVIKSTYEGLVSQVLLKTGEVSSGQGVIAIIPKTKNIRVGSTVSVNSADFVKKNQKVIFVNNDQQASIIGEGHIESYNLTEDLKEFDLQIEVDSDFKKKLLLGSKVDYKIVEESEEFLTTVPRSAIYQEEGAKYYVNTIKEVDGILGKKTIVEKKYVKILSKNDSFVAIDGITNEDNVIIDSSKALEDKIEVRVK